MFCCQTYFALCQISGQIHGVVHKTGYDLVWRHPSPRWSGTATLCECMFPKNNNNNGMEVTSFIINVMRLAKCNFATQNILTKPMLFSTGHCKQARKAGRSWRFDEKGSAGPTQNRHWCPQGNFLIWLARMQKSTAPRLEGFSGYPKKALDAYSPRAHRHTPNVIEMFRHSRECKFSEIHATSSYVNRQRGSKSSAQSWAKKKGN